MAPDTAAGRPRKAADSPRWCERCQKYGDHHTDRHDECAPTTAAPITVNLETLLRRLPPEALSRSAQETVDELLSKSNPPLSVHQRKRFLAAAERALRVRREILTLAAFASGHRSENGGRSCRECHKPFPCPDLLRAAGPALDAVAELKA